jgi:hypothetical protein
MAPVKPCRCGHVEERHFWGNTACVECPCPEYRVLETPDTLTLRGTQTPANAAEGN